MIAIGACNAISSFFSCYPGCASLSRSLMAQSGSGTQVALPTHSSISSISSTSFTKRNTPMILLHTSTVQYIISFARFFFTRIHFGILLIRTGNWSRQRARTYRRYSISRSFTWRTSEGRLSASSLTLQLRIIRRHFCKRN